MPRRATAVKKEIKLDAKFNNANVAKLVNRMMKCGKKSTSERIVYGALEVMGKQESQLPVDVLELALKNATPLLEVKARRIGGATYQVPVEVRPDRGVTMAMRWLIASAKSRSGKSMIDKLAAELTEASKGQGSAIKKREDTHKMAEANRAFAHFRW